MVRVYIVVMDGTIMGVFSTESKAKRWKQEFEEDCGYCGLEITPWIVDGEI